MICEHLIDFKNLLIDQGIKITYEGQPWSANCRHWIYFDCYFDPEHVHRRLSMDHFVIPHINNDAKSGLEYGLKCTHCHDAILGAHPTEKQGKATLK